MKSNASGFSLTLVLKADVFLAGVLAGVLTSTTVSVAVSAIPSPPSAAVETPKV